jgi:oligoendopeptidase F
MGHAVHASSIDPELEYWDRYCFPMGIAEVFSIFLERLTKDRKYLVHLGIKDHRVLDELCERNRFMELFFVTFYAANSLMKIEFWKKHLGVEEASELYARLMNRYTGIDMPGQYWMLHHILPDAVMYVPSYLLAAVRAAELEKLLKDEYGEEWWLDPKSGDLLKEIMRPGANLDIKRFSKLDVSHYLRQIGA